MVEYARHCSFVGILKMPFKVDVLKPQNSGISHGSMMDMLVLSDSLNLIERNNDGNEKSASK